MVAFFLMRFGRFGDFPGDAPNMSYIKSIISLRSFWVMILLFAVGIGGQIGVYTMMPLYLVSEKGLNTETTNTLIGLSQISALFMTFFSGWITDRMGEKKAIALFLMISGMMTVLLGLTSGTLLKVTLFLQPAIIVCYFPPGFAALSRIAQPPIRSLVSAWAAPLAFFLGGGLFPATLAYMGETFSFSLGLIWAGAIISMGAILVVFLRLQDTVDEGC
jgi:NNP family nitrate/nitrite transporter-like MFS transporter